MQALEVTGDKELEKALAGVMERSEPRSRQLHEELGSMALDAVRTHARTSMNDSRGTMQSWQEKHIGSRGGYAAVRPSKTPSGRSGPGAITNYVVSGHAISRPRGGTNYRPRIRVGKVGARPFYLTAEIAVAQRAQEMCEAFAEKLMEELK